MKTPSLIDEFNILTATDIKRLYSTQGFSTCHIAELYSISNATVWRKMVSLGIATRSHKGRMKSVSKEELKTLYWDKGLSMSEIAKLYHVNNSSVCERMQSFAIPGRPHGNKGSKNGSWKGGAAFASNGYRLVYISADNPLSSMANHQSYILEHRLVMARHLGRPLNKVEIVHHINGDKLDNRLENLELLPSQAYHAPYIKLQDRIQELEKEVRLLNWQVKQQNEQIRNLTTTLMGIGDK